MKSVNCFLLVAAICIGVPAMADSHMPENLADVWMIVVKDGHDEKFEAAFKKHIAHRSSKGDTRAWKTYAPVLGDDLNHYIVRYCCVSYAEMDQYRKWSINTKMDDHFNNNVDPHIEHYEHYFSRVDFKNNNWPEEDPGYQLFGVTSWQSKPGRAAAIEAAKATLSQHAKEGGWPLKWSWASRVGGESMVTIVTPYMNYAEMQGPEGGYAAFLAGRVGEEEAGRLLGAFSDNFHGSSYSVYRLIDDLSMKE